MNFRKLVKADHICTSVNWESSVSVGFLQAKTIQNVWKKKKIKSQEQSLKLEVIS